MSPKERSAFNRRIKRLGALAASLGVGERKLTGTVLYAWSKRLCPNLPAARLPVSKALGVHPQLQEFVQALLGVEPLTAAYWLSSGYAMWGSAERRTRLAMFFTPPSLTTRLLDDLAEQGANYAQHTFYDPACGGAAFLAPIALRMRDELRGQGRKPRTILRSIEQRLFGTDVDATLCELSRHFLCMVLADEIEAAGGAVPDFQVWAANSLTDIDHLRASIDVVVCNPPYRKMAAEEVARLREAYSSVIDAQPNLYGLFIGLSIELLRKGGLAGLVTPTSYMSGQYFSSLRTFVQANSDVLRIGVVSDRKGVYVDVEQETALTVLRRAPWQPEHRSTTQVCVVDAHGTYEPVGLTLLPNAGSTWPIPRVPYDERLLRCAQGATARLGDYGYAAKAGLFVWNRDTRPTFLDNHALAAAGVKTAVPLLWSRDVQDGKLCFKRARGPEDEHAFVDMGSKTYHSVIRRPGVLLQRVTSNDQPRRLVAAAIDQAFVRRHRGYVGENHTVVVERVREDAALSPEEMAQLLSTATLDRYFRCMSGSTNVSLFELNQLALPAPDLLRRQLHVGLSMDEALRAAYGL